MTLSLSELFQPAPPGITASGATPPTTAFYTVTGTVQLTPASPNVVGSGTEFTAQLEAQQTVQFSPQPGVFYSVLSITSDGALVLATNYSGPPAAAASLSAQSSSWLETLLQDGATLDLPTTSWQPGAVVRTVMAIMAVELSKGDSAVALQAQGGFLDFAATGFVTVTDIDGSTTTIAVSPDPSIPGQNPNANPTWLDVLASSVYNVTRTPGSAATNPLWLVNTTGASFGTFAPGTFHAGNNITGATYTAQNAFTYGASAVAGTFVSSVTVSAGGIVTVVTNSAHGLATGATVFLQNVLGLAGPGIINPTASAAGIGGGFATITVVNGTTFTLNGVTGAGAYTGTPLGKVFVPVSVTFAADMVGPAGNAAIGQILTPVNSIPGGAIGNLVTFAGNPWQSNTSLASACRGKLATLTPNGPKGAYLFYALVASQILAGQPVVNGGPVLPNPLPTNITLDGGPITRVLVSLSTGNGQVTATVANSSGPVGGCINNPISNVTAATPAVVTSANHGLVTGDYAQVNAVNGVNGVNGVFQITKVDNNNFQLNGSVGTGAYAANTGQVSGGDLYAVEAVLAAYTTPNTVTEITQSATAVGAAIGAIIYVPAAFVTQYQTAVSTALAAYFASFPIGGLNVDGQTNILPIGAIEGLLYAIGQQGGQIYTLSVTAVTINGGAIDLQLGATGVAVLGSTAAIQVIGV